MSVNVFGGTNVYAGYYEAYKGGEASVSISRGSGGSANIGKGFLVQQYQIQAQRGVNILRFCNTTDLAAQVGALQGTCQLTGLIGTKEDFAKLLAGEGTGSDICNPLTITINGQGGFQKCTQNGSESSDEAIEFIISGGIVSSFNITGQIDQNGVLMQQGTVTFTFTQLELQSGDDTEAARFLDEAANWTI